MSRSMAEQVCNLLGPKKDDKCFGDAGFSGMKPSAVIDLEGTKYEKLVEMALTLPMTADEFTAEKKLFEQSSLMLRKSLSIRWKQPLPLMAAGISRRMRLTSTSTSKLMRRSTLRRC